MKISYNWLKEYVDIRQNPKEVADLLTMHSFEIDGLEKIYKDSIIDVDVLPNRAHDCLSHIGIAKELGALINKKVKFKFPKVKENKKLKIEDYISVVVKDKKLCPRYTARVILNVEIGPSPKWLKERLESLGQNSINNVVDATNYVMLLIGQPLHAFDLDKLKDGKILVQRADEKELIETLGGDRYILDGNILTIRGKEGALAIAGIKGGKKAEIDNDTRNIVLESAYFEPTNIRRSSKKINLRTDSSLRFENGTSPTLCKDTIDLLADLIQDIAKGDIVSGVIDIKKDKEYKKTIIPFSTKDILDIIGIKIPEKDILAILKKLGFIIKKSTKKDIFLAEVPFERLDVELKEDLAEEVVRVYGYENIESKPMLSELWPAKRNESYFYEQKIKDILVGLGSSDVYNYSFVGDKEASIFDNKYPDLVSLLNPLSEDKKYLKPSLLFGLLNNVYENLKHQKSVRFFEIGKVFSLSSKKKVNEKKMLAGVFANKIKEKDSGESFYELKGSLDLFFSKLGISDFWLDDSKSNPDYSDHNFWHTGRVSEIKIGNNTVGIMGDVSHFVLEKMNIKTRVSAFEIDFDKLVSEATEEFAYQKVSKFPAVTRDIAILVGAEVRVDDVQSIIESIGGGFLIDVDLFDIYEDEKTDNSLSKSFAFHLIFQSQDKTLLDKEINEIMKKIVDALKEKNWELKGGE